MALSLRRRPKTSSRHQCRRIVRLLPRSCPLSFGDWRTVDVFLEYVLPRLNCSIRGCFTSTWPVSFSGKLRAITYYSHPLQSCNGLYSSPIFISRGGQNWSSPFVSREVKELFLLEVAP